jgi:hypothetical protein
MRDCLLSFIVEFEWLVESLRANLPAASVCVCVPFLGHLYSSQQALKPTQPHTGNDKDKHAVGVRGCAGHAL